ncbi:hypothetical protein R3P38DRAFT_2901237 [Favolaschia claudopus]|uniref:Secreted protein n=1 Tax=Favolaschia claudopus TaxID=2862362 RepID=A0AAW0CN38_9AGAR
MRRSSIMFLILVTKSELLRSLGVQRSTLQPSRAYLAQTSTFRQHQNLRLSQTANFWTRGPFNPDFMRRFSVLHNRFQAPFSFPRSSLYLLVDGLRQMVAPLHELLGMAWMKKVLGLTSEVSETESQ